MGWCRSFGEYAGHTSLPPFLLLLPARSLHLFLPAPPPRNDMESTSDLEEEKRLAYVGCTRAMDRLYLVRAEVSVEGLRGGRVKAACTKHMAVSCACSLWRLVAFSIPFSLLDFPLSLLRPSLPRLKLRADPCLGGPTEQSPQGKLGGREIGGKRGRAGRHYEPSRSQLPLFSTPASPPPPLQVPFSAAQPPWPQAHQSRERGWRLGRGELGGEAVGF
jgi:hypothetical protein